MRRRRSHGGLGEQTGSVDRLSKRFGRYALVVGVARRAQDLKDRIDSALEPSGGGMLNRALGEIARGEVRIRAESPEEEAEEEEE
jgi:DNA-directed RNA polymerase subunit K/omega